MTVAGSSSATRPRVVVVGGGFAGLSAVRELREANVEVLLLDRDPYTTFQPLLYQVATGALNAGDITYALRSFAGHYRNVRFRRACVVGLDPVARRVRLDDGLEVGYDYLILGCGVTANFFGIPGAAEHARTTYTRAAAIGVRDRVLGNLEAYAQGSEGAVEPVAIVVGGGPTGVEMAGALAELRNAGLAYAYPEVDPERVRVVLVEMTDEVLAPFDPKLREYAAGALRAKSGAAAGCCREGGAPRLCGAFRRRAGAVRVDDLGDRCQGRRRGVGVGAAPGARRAALGRARPAGGGPPGDLRCRRPGRGPRRAAAAAGPSRHRRRAARRGAGPAPAGGGADQAVRLPRPRHLRDDRRSDAVIQLPFGVKLRGLVAWLGWVGLHVVLLMGGRNRVATTVNLAVRYLSWRRAPNVIVGDPP